MSEPTNTNIDYLATLPSELVERILISTDLNRVLDIKFQLSLDKNKDDKYKHVRFLCEERLSVTRYLDSIFGHGNGIKILTAMAKSQTYMSGSMAAEFHTPGVAVSTSDCDFFINRDVRQVYRFMNDLTDIGVVWWTVTETFTKSLKKVGDEVTVSVALFRQLTHDGTVNGKMIDLGLNANSIISVGSENDTYCTITVDETNLVVDYHDKPNMYASLGRDIHIVQGEFVKGKEYTPIQLIIEKRLPSMKCAITAPMGFHSSGTQAFIGPCSSGHMYSNLTSSMKMIGWSSIAKRTDGLPLPSTEFIVDTTNVRQWNKFKRRGFTYVSTDGDRYHCRLRTITDSDSFYTEYPNDIDVPYFVKELYMDYSRNLAWFETSTGVIKVRAPINTIRKDQWKHVEAWLHEDDVPRNVCVEYLTRYMPNQTLLRDALISLRRLTLAENHDSDVVDEE